VPLVDQWLYSRLTITIETVNEALRNYRFHEAAQNVYQFFWGDFCDWYIEWVKPELLNANRERAVVAWKNLFAAFSDALRLLHPFMPFLTEELWHQLPQAAGAKSIALDTFPTAREEWTQGRIVDAVEIFSLVQDVITRLRDMRAEQKLSPKQRVSANFWSTAELVRKRIAAESDAIVRLAFLSEFRISDHPLDHSGGTLRSAAQFDLWLARPSAPPTNLRTVVVGIDPEVARLKKEIEGLQKAVSSKESQLANETFRSRAPEKIIKGLEETLATQRIELKKLEDRLAQLLQ
jgi:valyl-tRNA synthetase